ncbi:MAG: segregation/condensation protein A, partial [Pirellulaceae bacterium]|nr:segregation/condensation protein A [Pirellulaceae bacterium]
DWQQHYPRAANDLPPRRVDLADQPIQEVELWDLVSAFGRVIRENKTARPSNIVYDETPIQSYMRTIHHRLVEEDRVAFTEFFATGMHKSALIGVFLAILELVRHHGARTEQTEPHGEIWIVPGPGFIENIDLSEVDNYGVPVE